MIAAFFGRAVDGKYLVDRLAIAGVCWVNGYKNRGEVCPSESPCKVTLSYTILPKNTLTKSGPWNIVMK